MREQCEHKYQVKTQVLGPGNEHVTELTFSNRIFWNGHKGITYEADPRHIVIVVNT